MPLIRQGGAIVVRETAAEPEVLLVRAKRNPQYWIFPKGHQEKNETLAETAVRELSEEGGVTGEPVESVGVSTFRSGDDKVEVTYFLVRFTGTSGTAEREVTWRRFKDARALLTFDDLRQLLETACRVFEDRPR